MNSGKVDYYKVLEVDKSASAEEIKKSYKKLAIKWHPDKNLQNKEEAVQRFRQISEAYEVLSNEEKRKKYDLYGSEGAKSYSSTNFKYSDANDIFKAFFSAYGFENKSDNSFFDQYFKARGEGSGSTYYKYSTSTSSDPFGGTTYYKYTKPQESQGAGQTYSRAYGTNGTYYKFSNSSQTNSNNTYNGFTTGTGSSSSTGNEELPKQGEKIRTVHHVTREFSNGTKQTIKRTTILSSDGSKQITQQKLDGTNKSTYYVIGGSAKSGQQAAKSTNFSGYNFGKRPQPQANEEKTKLNNENEESEDRSKQKLYKKVSEPSKVYYADGSEGVYYGSFGSVGNQNAKTKVYYTVRK